MLTDAGRRMVAAAARVEDEVATLSRELAGQDQRLEGTVRVTCGDELLAGLLLADLASWCAAHPGVELAMTTAWGSWCSRPTSATSSGPWCGSRRPTCGTSQASGS